MRVAVILGAAVWPGGVPSPTLRRRVNKAIELWKAGQLDLIVASGGLGKNPPSEAEAMASELTKAGIALEKIILEDQSNSTLTNAQYTLEKLKDIHVTDLIVVTDGYHCLRARLTFQALGVRARAVSASGTPPVSRFRTRIKAWLREGLALPFYLWRLRGVRKSENPPRA